MRERERGGGGVSVSLMKAIIPDYCRERERERKKEKERTCEAIGFEQVLIGNSHMIIAPSSKGFAVHCTV